MISGDTIAAISSAAGSAARMVVRMSGPRAHAIAAALCPAMPARSAGADRTTLILDGMGVSIWLYRFLAPRSYTGEDMAELHVPGNPLLARMVLDQMVRHGARTAEAGEFTARAYFNGRMDLTEAEGVAATISAHGEQELAAARQLLAGELARRLEPLMEQLTQTLALVEMGIDFSEEDIAFLSPDHLLQQIRRVDTELDRLVSESARFERLTHEPRFVLVGRPNAGKSTLLNALSGTQRAVVSPVAGTTRDVIWSQIPLDRGLVRLVDAAGLEEHLPPADDSSPASRIARQMHEHALAAIEAADFVLLVHDATDPAPLLDCPRTADLVVLTKLDRLDHPPPPAEDRIAISATSGTNLELLRARMSELAFGAEHETAPALALNARHLQAIDEARAALARAGRIAASAGSEIVALELREAIDALGRILGQVTPDDVLGRVFATFCIGK